MVEREVSLGKRLAATEVATTIENHVVNIEQNKPGRQRRAALNGGEQREIGFIASAESKPVPPIQVITAVELEGVWSISWLQAVIRLAQGGEAHDGQVKVAVDVWAGTSVLVRTGKAGVVTKQATPRIA